MTPAQAKSNIEDAVAAFLDKDVETRESYSELLKELPDMINHIVAQIQNGGTQAHYSTSASNMLMVLNLAMIGISTLVVADPVLQSAPEGREFRRMDGEDL